MEHKELIERNLTFDSYAYKNSTEAIEYKTVDQ